MSEARPARVLVVEDDPDIWSTLRLLLQRAGHSPTWAPDGRQALEEYGSARPDLVVLDLTLPEVDGWSVLRHIRGQGHTPVLLLTARGFEADKVRGLQDGADDYLTKPFGNSELTARVAALLRRHPPEERGPGTGVYDDGVVRMGGGTHTVAVNGRTVELTPTERRLLQVLVDHAGQVLSPAQLLAHGWRDPSGIGAGRVRFTVGNLRRKCGWTDLATCPLETVRGFGYRYRRPAG